MLVRSGPPIFVPLVLAFVALAFASAVGCGDANNAPAAVQFDACLPLLLVPDADVSSDQLNGIAGALRLWNTSAATRIELTAAGATATDATVTDATVTPSLPIHFQSAAAPFHGLYDDRNVQIFVNQDLVDHARIVAIAHEMGHAFGLVHVAPEQRLSLMNSGNITVDPTPDDVSALAARWGRCPAPAGAQP